MNKSSRHTSEEHYRDRKASTGDRYGLRGVTNSRLQEAINV